MVTETETETERIHSDMSVHATATATATATVGVGAGAGAGGQRRRRLEDLTASGSWSEPALQERCLGLLRTQGACILDTLVKPEVLKEAKEVVEPTLGKIAEKLRQSDQRLTEADKEAFFLVRAPPVEEGKTNVHFDEYESREHEAMEKLAQESQFSEIVSAYVGKPCSLYEAGASITTAGGNGMEWHRDGCWGECTVLMSLSNVPEDQGQVGLIPGSHKNAVLNKTEDEEVSRETIESKAVWYPYRAGQPLLIDARTQHAVKKNVSDETRCILW